MFQCEIMISQTKSFWIDLCDEAHWNNKVNKQGHLVDNKGYFCNKIKDLNQNIYVSFEFTR